MTKQGAQTLQDEPKDTEQVPRTSPDWDPQILTSRLCANPRMPHAPQNQPLLTQKHFMQKEPPRSRERQTLALESPAGDIPLR